MHYTQYFTYIPSISRIHTRAYMFAHIHELFPTSRLTIRLLYNMLLLAVLHSDDFKCPSDFRRPQCPSDVPTSDAPTFRRLQSPSDFRRPQCPSDVPTSDAPTFRRLSCAEKKSVAVSASAPPQPYRLATAPTFTRLSDLSDGASTPIQFPTAQRRGPTTNPTAGQIRLQTRLLFRLQIRPEIRMQIRPANMN